MENKEILERLLGNLKMIQEIRNDDGYVIYRIACIGRSSVEILEQLQTDDKDDKILINDAIDRLNLITAIEKRYYDDSEYAKWVRKEKASGNVHIFMEAINCVEGALEIFLNRVGWYK